MTLLRHPPFDVEMNTRSFSLEIPFIRAVPGSTTKQVILGVELSLPRYLFLLALNASTLPLGGITLNCCLRCIKEELEARVMVVVVVVVLAVIFPAGPPLMVTPPRLEMPSRPLLKLAIHMEPSLRLAAENSVVLAHRRISHLPASFLGRGMMGAHARWRAAGITRLSFVIAGNCTGGGVLRFTSLGAMAQIRPYLPYTCLSQSITAV